MYLVLQSSRWYNLDGSTTTTELQSNYHSSEDFISFKDSGFKIAFGVVDFDTTEVLNDRAHIEWVVAIEKRKDNKLEVRTPLAIHKCTVEDLQEF